MTNCPNCGAPITKGTCEYCGTVFADPYCGAPIASGTVFVDPYKEQIIKLEQEILRAENDILLLAKIDAIISSNTWRAYLLK